MSAPPPGDGRHLTVYSGRDLVGSVAGARRDWRAFDARDNQLPGQFRSLKAAIAAVNMSLPCSCVCDASARRDNSA